MSRIVTVMVASVLGAGAIGVMVGRASVTPSKAFITPAMTDAEAQARTDAVFRTGDSPERVIATANELSLPIGAFSPETATILGLVRFEGGWLTIVHRDVQLVFVFDDDRALKSVTAKSVYTGP